MDQVTEPLELWFDSLKVGYVHEAFVSENTWFGRAELRIRPEEGELQQLILEFVALNEEWNERARSEGADADEFEKYPELIHSGKWYVRASHGEIDRIMDSPVFFAGNEVTWNVKE